MNEFPDVDETVASLAPEDLKEQIDAGESVFLLDTRAQREFETWRIEGENVDIVNYPYYEFVEGVPDDVADVLPDERGITVLCAKGGASEMVAARLEDEGYDVDHLEGGMKGWARIYEYIELDVESEATIAQYQRPSSGCLAYLVASDGEAAVIDPLRAFTAEYERDARMLDAELKYAIDTHVHADHVSGVRSLATETDATAILPEPAADRGIEYDVPYETVTDGDVVSVGGVDVEAVHTPGHTTGMTAFVVGNVVFTGDGLFTESVARPDLEDPEAAADAAATLYTSLQERILPRPDETIIAPAHFSRSATTNRDGTYTATVGHLKASMDALSMDRDEFVEFVTSDMPPQPANHEEIIAINLGHRSTDDESAFELELGPNNCASSDGALSG